MSTAHEILGVSEGATDAEVKKAFRKLAHKHHPDKGGNAERFKKINNAYQAIKDGNASDPVGGGHYRKSEDTHKDWGGYRSVYRGRWARSSARDSDFTYRNYRFSNSFEDFEEIMNDLRDTIERERTYQAHKQDRTYHQRQKCHIRTSVNMTISFEESVFGAKKRVVVANVFGDTEFEVGINIKPGVVDGSLRTFKAVHDGKYFSIDVRFSVISNTNYSMSDDGKDIHGTVVVTKKEWVLGSVKSCSWLKGQKLGFSVPPLCKGRIIVNGYGVPKPYGNSRIIFTVVKK